MLHESKENKSCASSELTLLTARLASITYMYTQKNPILIFKFPSQTDILGPFPSVCLLGMFTVLKRDRLQRDGALTL